MNKFKVLLMMQLKEKLDLSFLKSKKKTLFKVVFSLIGFIAVVAATYLIFSLCKKFNLFSSLNKIPLSVVALIFFVVFVMNLFTITLGLSKTLYYSKDNQVLVTYPVNANNLFFSKMLVYYISEVKKCFQLLVPILVAYGVCEKLSIFFYIWMPFVMIIFTAIPVLLGGLLSIPMNYIVGFLKKVPIIKVLFLLAVLAGVIAGVVYVISLIPEDINLLRSWVAVSKAIRAFLSGFVKIFYPFYAIAICLCGKVESNMRVQFLTSYTYIVFLIILGTIVVLGLLNYITSRPLYLKLITKQFEFDSRKKNVEKKNRVHGGFFSMCLYDIKRQVRDTKTFSTTLATLVVAPISILLLNRVYSAINTRLIGNYFTISFNVLIILLFVLAHNISASSVYSRDGEALFLNKTKPQKPVGLLFSRFAYYIFTSTAILLASSVVFFVFAKLTFVQCLCLFVMMWSISMSHIVWSGEIDFLNPKQEIFKTEGASAYNPNEFKSTILTFLMSLIIVVIMLFFMIFDMNKMVWIKLALVALAFLVLRVYLFAIKAKTLFREM